MGPKNSQTQPLRIIFIAISAIALLIFTPALSRGEKPFFSIALSKFSSEEAAKKEELNLKNSGNNAFYRREKNPENNQIEYQVYIEKYNSVEEATREAKVLKDLELISDYHVKEVVDTPMPDEHLPDTLSEGSGILQAAGDVRHGLQPEAKQEERSGQIRREQISFKKETTTPGDAPEKPGGQPPLAAQSPADKIPVSEAASEKKVLIKEAVDQTKGAALQ
ncbi:MAG: hypothetical protein GX846_06535, partial [Deltaproteobacteria bacterium]|nr:hypothetical protein [Deltaproteobacteria bacterium]